MNKLKRRIVILSAPIGAGHMLAARAIREAALDLRDDIEVVEATAFDFLPGNIGHRFLRLYLMILRRCPWLYQAVYRWGNQQGGSLRVRNCLNGWLARRAHKWLQQQAAECIICTHATPAGIVSAWKKRYKKSVPLYGVITDYVVHSWWLYKEVDGYFVADEKIKTALTGRLQAKQQVHAAGIPIRAGFSQPADRAAFRRQKGIGPDAFVCLLMGGGNGLLPMELLLERCRALPNTHVVAITGSNEALYRRLTQRRHDNVTVLGSVHDVWNWMRCADVLVSKAGGVTAAEATALGLPLLFFRPLPGQEMGNVRFLEAAGAAVRVETVEALVAELERLASACSGERVAKPELQAAAQKIVITILGKNAGS